MNRIAKRFQALRESGRKALIPFITAGDPHPDITVPLMHSLVKAGADIIELGVPFSDPMADGPVIQVAAERALQHNVSLRDVLVMVKKFRHDDKDTPVVLMGYLNPVEIMGYDTCAKDCAVVGADALLIVDLPPEESGALVPELRRHDLDLVFLLAPTTTPQRMEKICAQAGGFVYYVSLKGVTGSANLDVQAVASKVAEIRKHTDLPVGVGFGIKDASTAAQISKVADAVVVGSALVQRIADLPLDQIVDKAPQLIAGMRAAMDSKQ